MSNFELPSHTPNFDLTWQQWLARQANLLTIDSTNTVSNKTINLSDNTLIGTTAQFNAALSDSNFLTDASIGSTVQAWDANLDQIAALSPTDNNFIVGNGDSWALETPSDARTSLGLGTMATQNANNVDIDGGTIDGVTIGGADPVTIVCDDLTIQDTNANIPQLLMSATDGAANLKNWRWRVTGSGLQLDAINDAFNTTRTALAFTKNNSQTITSISMGSAGNTLLTLNASTLDINADAIDIDGGSAASASITGDISSIALTVSGSFTVNGSNVLTASGVGSTVQAWDADLDALAANSTNGFWARTGAGTGAARTLTGTANEITVTNGVGDADPTFSLPSALAFTGKTVTGGTYVDPAITNSATGIAVTITLTDSTATGGPDFTLHRASSSPDAGDDLGIVRFSGMDSGGNVTSYANIRTDIVDATDTSEDGALLLRTMQAGTLRTLIDCQTGVQVYGTGTAPTGGDKGAGTINAAGDIYRNNSLVTYESGTHTLTGSWTWTTGAAGTSPVTIRSTEAGASGGPLLDLDRDSASPAANDVLAQIRFLGNDSGGTTTQYANILGFLLDPTDGSEDADVRIQTLVAGTSATRIIIRNGIVVGSATGGDQGAGTLNAVAVYDDGVLLTDYVFDAEVDGDYSVVDYDSRVPQPETGNGSPLRQHGPARRFKTNFNELNPVDFANKWKSTRKLPAFNRGPSKKSTGEAIQALIETCEVLAVHLDKHETRLQALEA